MSEIKGIINLIKPPGMTSFQAVKWVKRYFSVNKVGHTGTLDPGAAGVLPVCLGRATKMIPYIPEEEKEYVGEITLGVITDTLDAEGKLLKKDDNWRGLSADTIETTANQFKGKIEQVPPMYSALHFNGKRLYELARKGKVIERKPRQVVIKEIQLLDIDLPLVRFKVICSRGTYIRSLAADIGGKLSTGAYLSFLIRTRSGPFYLKDAFTFEEIIQKGKETICPLDYPLNYPLVAVKEGSIKKARNGQILTRDDLVSWPDHLQSGERVSIYDRNGSFISIDEIVDLADKKIKIKPVRVFV